MATLRAACPGVLPSPSVPELEALQLLPDEELADDELEWPLDELVLTLVASAPPGSAPVPPPQPLKTRTSNSVVTILACVIEVKSQSKLE